MEKVEGLDGLRAIFVVAVLFFHILLVFYPENLDYFGGGFLAVESFFVLSGFLITRSLIKIFSEKEGFSGLVKFLEKRYLRLFPAFVFLISTEVFVVNLVFPNFTEKLLSETFAGSFNVYNWWLIFRQVPYFEKFSDTLFNLHLWSLSIEWQFYLIWAFIYSLIFRFSLRFLNIFLIISILASITDMFLLYTLFDNVDRVYFGTDTRFFSFLLGSLLALNIDNISKRNVLFVVLGLLGLFYLFVEYYAFKSYNEFMYPFGFLAVSLTTLMLMVAVLKSDYFNYILSIQPLKWIGERSYSIYLWHYPIFVFLSLLYSNKYLDVLIVAILITLFIANISYLFIEEPFRKLSLKEVFSLKSAFNMFISFIVLGLSLFYLSILQPQKESEKFEKAVSIKIDDNQTTSYEVEVYNKKENLDDSLSNEESQNEVQSVQDVDSKDSDIFIIGDSVVLGAYKYLKKYIPNSDVDAKVGRQFKELEDILSSKNLEKYKKVIIALGNNGYVKKSDLENILDRLKDKEVYLVTVKVPKPWQNDVNNLLKKMAAERPNVHVVDWYYVSQDKEDIFVNDKVHLNPKGAKLYASILKNSIFGKNYKPKKILEEPKEERNETTVEVESVTVN
jgi:peptidoglycan/LPS O-acetylase OafA/YrhL